MVSRVLIPAATRRYWLRGLPCLYRQCRKPCPRYVLESCTPNSIQKSSELISRCLLTRLCKCQKTNDTFLKPSDFVIVLLSDASTAPRLHPLSHVLPPNQHAKDIGWTYPERGQTTYKSSIYMYIRSACCNGRYAGVNKCIMT